MVVTVVLGLMVVTLVVMWVLERVRRRRLVARAEAGQLSAADLEVASGGGEVVIGDAANIAEATFRGNAGSSGMGPR
jgi:hypothetical protein